MNVLFLAGGLWQKPFVQYLKSQGLKITVVNPIVTETTLLADHHLVADINDLDKINEYIEKTKPCFITSDQSDVSTLIVAQLSEKWGLIGNHSKVIKYFSNKFAMCELCKSIGIQVPETALIDSVEDVCQFGKTYGFPIIIKPIDATMSRGFRKLENQDDVQEQIITDCLTFSKSKQIIAQKFIDGDMITLEGVCSGGKHRTIASSKKDKYLKPGINSGVRYPCNLAVLKDVIQFNDRYVEAAGMIFGLTHGEYIVNENGQYFIEIGARGGGSGIADKIVPWVSGVNSYDIMFRSLCGQIIDVKSLSLLNRPAHLKYYTQEEVNNPDIAAILAIPGVAAFHYNFMGQQYVQDKLDVRHSMGIYLAETNSELEQITSMVSKLLK